MRISLIVAMSENRVIGRGGQLPWRLSADLQRFKRLTMGHPLIMGRKTLESIGRALPGRTSIVVTRQRDYAFPGVLVAHDLDGALRLAAGESEVFVVGGEQIYRLAVPKAECVYLTMVHAHLVGDASFPSLAEEEWEVVEETRHPATPRDTHDSTFRILQRRGAQPS